MNKLLALLSGLLLLSPTVWAADDPSRTKYIPSIGWSLDAINDLTSAGTVSGTTVAATDLDCTAAEFTNGGAVTTNVNGEFICSDDDGGSSGNSFETISTPAGTSPVADSSTDTLTLTETAGIDLVGTAGTDTIDVAIDLTELSGAVTFGSGGVTSLVLNGSGDDFGIHQEGGISYWKNATDGVNIWLSDTSNAFTIPSLVNCNTIDTNANGKLICGTDATGAGGGDAITVNSSAATDPDFADGDIDWTLTGGNSITATVGCASCVTLSSETAGNFVATLADSGTGNLTVSGSGSEDAAVTINTVQNILTTSSPTFANLLLAGTGPDVRATPTGGESFHFGAEYAATTGTLGLISDATSGVHYLTADLDDNLVTYGDANVKFHRFRTDGTGDGEVVLPNDSIGPSEVVDTATNHTLEPQSAKLSGTYVTATISGLDAAAESATISGGSGPWKVLFSAGTDQAAVWPWVLPDDWVSHGTLNIIYSLASATTLEVEWEAAIQCVTPGDAADIDTASFAAGATSGGLTVPSTAGYTVGAAITLTDDACAAGDLIYFYVSTDADDAVNDDAAGDRELLAVEYNYTRQ